MCKDSCKQNSKLPTQTDDLMQACHQRLHVLTRVVEGKARSCRGGNIKVLEQGLYAMMPRAYGDVV